MCHSENIVLSYVGVRPSGGHTGRTRSNRTHATYHMWHMVTIDTSDADHQTHLDPQPNDGRPPCEAPSSASRDPITPSVSRWFPFLPNACTRLSARPENRMSGAVPGMALVVCMSTDSEVVAVPLRLWYTVASLRACV